MPCSAARGCAALLPPFGHKAKAATVLVEGATCGPLAICQGRVRATRGAYDACTASRQRAAAGTELSQAFDTGACVSECMCWTDGAGATQADVYVRCDDTCEQRSLISVSPGIAEMANCGWCVWRRPATSTYTFLISVSHPPYPRNMVSFCNL